MWFRNIFRRKHGQGDRAGAETDRGDLTLTGQTFSQLNRLRLRSTQHLRGAGSGRRPSTRRRPASDFREHRKYVSGDDFRFVDWKASARSEQVFLKQGEHPQETTIHLLVDTSASMAWGDPPKSGAVIRLAAALGYLALNGDDRLHLVRLVNDGAAEGGSPVQEWTFKGKGSFPGFWNILRELRFGGKSRLLPTLRSLAGGSRGGMVLLLSDLLDEADFSESLSLLPRPAWEISVLHTLHRRELEPALQGEFEMVDVETRAEVNYDIDAAALETYRENIETWRTGLERACIDQRAFYTLLSTDWALDRETLPHLLRLNLLESA